MTVSGIKFGTDGWRATIADTFTIPNVKLVCQAIADYLKSNDKGSKLIIGYDTRFFSEQFAAAAASVLTANGFQVFLPKRALPTPVVAYAIKLHQAAGAIMFTASHNPYYYHGIKFISDRSGPASSEVTTEIEKNIGLLLDRPDQIYDAADESLIEEIDPFPAYLDHLEELVDFDAIRQSGLKVVVDPLFGAGHGLLETIFERAGCSVAAIHNCRDVFFGGQMPDPSSEILSELKKTVLEQKALAGLALDGDGDRFGLIDQDGNYLSPNQLIPLITIHLINNRNLRGSIIRTVATTHLLDKIAAEFNCELIETPVGFKYICEQMLKVDVLIGGEESGGLSVKGHIPEKDGLLACLLAIEAVAFEDKTLSEILEEIYDRYGFFQSVRLDLRLPQEKKDALIAELTQRPPRQFAGQDILGANRIDGMKFLLAKGDWLLIRSSGTEPLIRVYIETTSTERLQDLKDHFEQYLEPG